MAWTAEQAREMSRKGAEASRQIRLLTPAFNRERPERYTARRLGRVRRQLDRIDRMMTEENDPARLDRLASAQARLSVQEFALAGRPMPGMLRPSSGRPAREPARSIAPLGPSVQPAAPAPSPPPDPPTPPPAQPTTDNTPPLPPA